MGLPNIGPMELLLILAVLLLIVGPRRLPEMGQAVGRTIREFRKASTEITDATSVEPVTTATPGSPSTSAPAAIPAAIPTAAVPATAVAASAVPASADASEVVPGAPTATPANSDDATRPA